jgi:hypothetical protein
MPIGFVGLALLKLGFVEGYILVLFAAMGVVYAARRYRMREKMMAMKSMEGFNDQWGVPCIAFFFCLSLAAGAYVHGINGASVAGAIGRSFASTEHVRTGGHLRGAGGA